MAGTIRCCFETESSPLERHFFFYLSFAKHSVKISEAIPEQKCETECQRKHTKKSDFAKINCMNVHVNRFLNRQKSL